MNHVAQMVNSCVETKNVSKRNFSVMESQIVRMTLMRTLVVSKRPFLFSFVASENYKNWNLSETFLGMLKMLYINQYVIITFKLISSNLFYHKTRILLPQNYLSNPKTFKVKNRRMKTGGNPVQLASKRSLYVCVSISKD